MHRRPAWASDARESIYRPRGPWPERPRDLQSLRVLSVKQDRGDLLDRAAQLRRVNTITRELHSLAARHEQSVIGADENELSCGRVLRWTER